MNRRKRLAIVRRDAIHYLDRLRGWFASIDRNWPASQQDMSVSHVTINLLNTWSNFVRAYYLSCALSTKSSKGVKISAAVRITSVNDAIGKAVTKYRPTAKAKSSGAWDRREEPTWHDTNTLLSMATEIGMSNAAQVAAALSLGSRVFSDLPTVRNYFAHRNESTFNAAIGIASFYGIAKRGEQPSTILRKRPLGRPQALLSEWIDDIHATIEMLCH